MSDVSENKKNQKMPVIFIGHGSPMNALATTTFTQSLEGFGRRYPKPKAVLCISAHWMTEGTWVTHMKNPKTIHDFYGFPDELFAVQYPAPGSPEVAELVSATVKNAKVNLDDEMWGLDHGTWSVLRHMYPQADIPVVQLSLYLGRPSEYHYNLGAQLKELRNQGVLIVGSGNVVHNLRNIKWEPTAEPFDWAVEFDAWLKEKVVARDFEPLLYDFAKTQAGKLSVPTLEHYLPLFYILGASDKEDQLRFEFEGIENGSISMRTISFGA